MPRWRRSPSYYNNLSPHLIFVYISSFCFFHFDSLLMRLLCRYISLPLVAALSVHEYYQGSWRQKPVLSARAGCRRRSPAPVASAGGQRR